MTDPDNISDFVNPGAPVLEARGLRKHFKVSGGLLRPQHSRIVQAVNDVSFSLHKQRTLCIVGESGCGKTTTARMLLDLEQPTSGSVLFQGRTLDSLRKQKIYSRYRLGVQAVFQDSSSALNPRRRIKNTVAEPLIVSGRYKGSELEDYVVTLLERVGLPAAVLDSFPHELSGGMRQRVAIAQGMATNPSVIILDEPVSALDVSIRAQILNLLKDMQDQFGVSYVLIAHDLATVRYLSHSVAAMYLGAVVEQAPAEQFFTEAMHPYTLALLSAAIPRTTGEESPRIVLKGDLPSPASPPSGCRFHTRCWLRKKIGDPSICATQNPVLQPINGEHSVSCHFIDEAGKSTARRNIVGQIGRERPKGETKRRVSKA